jgi:hypothetical protein
METMPVTCVLSLRISKRKKKYTLVDIFCFEEQSSVILVIKLELQHSGLATAEVKSILGFFFFICCLFVAAIWFNVSSTDWENSGIRHNTVLFNQVSQMLRLYLLDYIV